MTIEFTLEILDADDEVCETVECEAIFRGGDYDELKTSRPLTKDERANADEIAQRKFDEACAERRYEARVDRKYADDTYR